MRVPFAVLFATPIVLGFLLRIPGLDRPLNEIMGFRQTQTAFTVREFMRHGISLIHSPLPVFGPSSDVPLEFPLFQAFAAIIGKLGLDPDAASRLAGLICFQLTAVLVGILALQWFSRTTALVAVTLFQLPPFAAQWGFSSLIEFMATAAAIGAVVCMNLWVLRRRPALLGAVVILQSVAFLVKPTTAGPWLLAFAVPAIAAVMRSTSRPERWRVLGLVCLAPAVSALLTLIWTKYADGVKADNPYTTFITSSELHQWTFGTLAQRRDSNSWILIFNRLPAIGGSTALLFVAAVVAIACWRASAPIIALVLIPVASVATFFNLYVIHDYYLCAIYPAMILVVAAAIAGVAHRFSDRRTAMAVVAATCAGVLALAWTSPQGQVYQANLAVHAPFPALSQEIQEATRADDGVITVGCDWDPTILYYADRRGLMLRPDQVNRQIPAGMVPGSVSYLAYCGAPDAMAFLPPTVRATPVSPNIFRLSLAT